MDFWQNKRIWVVGASSGIGEGLIGWLVSSKAKALISARRDEILREIQARFPKDSVRLLKIDVEDHQSLEQKGEEAWSIFGGFDVVFLNAGMSVRDLVSETEVMVEKRIMNINFWGPVVLTKTLLKLKQPNDALHLVVTSSLSGKYGVPKLAAYAASKHALHGYFDSLRAETAQTNLKIHLVIPGFVKTAITVAGFRGDGTLNGKMQNALEKGMDPGVCAKYILEGVAKGKEEFVVGGSERFTVILNRLFPSWNRALIRSNPLQRLAKIKRFFGFN